MEQHRPLVSNNKNMQKGFTFIEILVVATIISLLAGIGAVSYSTFSKQSRDAKRKADLEQIRAAVEMYRSNNGSYPLTASFNIANCNNPSLSDANTTYLSKTPIDPKCTDLSYTYSSDGTTYTVAAHLETGSGSCGGLNCPSASYLCNYCLGPYGQL